MSKNIKKRKRKKNFKKSENDNDDSISKKDANLLKEKDEDTDSTKGSITMSRTKLRNYIMKELKRRNFDLIDWTVILIRESHDDKLKADMIKLLWEYTFPKQGSLDGKRPFHLNPENMQIVNKIIYERSNPESEEVDKKELDLGFLNPKSEKD